MSALVRVHRIPFSTNVERVALACGLKGLEVEWVDHDPADRADLVALSGQPLTPVAELGAEVVTDSPVILERIDVLHPDPPLYPRDPSERFAAEVFVEWFNEVWKGPPNALDVDPPPTEPASLIARIDGWTKMFERRLRGSDYLLGPEPGIADVIAYPFLRYAVDPPDPADDERFHAILHERLAPGSHPALDAWVARVGSIPHA